MIPAGPSRRAHIEARSNPAFGLDYLVVLEGALAPARLIVVHYVPDRLIADHGSFVRYLAAVESLPWETLEHLGASVMDDIGNALVPRWLRVELRAGAPGTVLHRVRLDDRQPQWRNDALLSGL